MYLVISHFFVLNHFINYLKFYADLVTFTEKILNGKSHFLSNGLVLHLTQRDPNF